MTYMRHVTSTDLDDVIGMGGAKMYIQADSVFPACGNSLNIIMNRSIRLQCNYYTFFFSMNVKY